MIVDRIVTDLLKFIHSLLYWREQKVDNRPYSPIGQAMRGSMGVLQEIRKHPLPGQIADRSVCYIIFMPFRNTRQANLHDIHIDCSFLGAIESSDPKTEYSLSELARIAKTSRESIASLFGEKPVYSYSDFWLVRKIRDFANQRGLNFEQAAIAYNPRTSHRSRAPTHQITVLEASHWIDRRTGRWETKQIYVGEHDLQGTQEHRDLFCSKVVWAIAQRLLLFDLEDIDWEFEISAARKEVMRQYHTRARMSQAIDTIKLKYGKVDPRWQD